MNDTSPEFKSGSGSRGWVMLPLLLLGGCSRGPAADYAVTVQRDAAGYITSINFGADLMYAIFGTLAFMAFCGWGMSRRSR